MDANSNSQQRASAASPTGQEGDNPCKTFVPRGLDRRAAPKASYTAPFPLPLFSCDRFGAIVNYNEAAAALWGRRPDLSKPGQWSGAVSLLDDDGSPLPRSEFPAARAFENGADEVGKRAMLVRPDGSTRRVMAYARPTRDEKGEIKEVVCALIDHTERYALLEAANRAEDEKNAFIAMLSHELRNPLSPILNAAVVMKKVSSDTQVAKLADVVERQAKRLSRFVQDLLLAANLAQGGVVLTLASASLAEVMQAAVDTLLPLAKSRSQSVKIESIPGAVLLCDAERVSQALANIMANASEFTGRDGEINVRAYIDGTWARIEVEDTGIGIDSRHIDEIFKPYTHFATHAERARAGAGLGLALAKDICEKHGGSISAFSQGIGLGSRFTISLPIAASPSDSA